MRPLFAGLLVLLGFVLIGCNRDNLPKGSETKVVRDGVEKSKPVEPKADFDVTAESLWREIEENDYNLNIPRYVDTFEPEEDIELGAALSDLASSEQAASDASKKLHALLKN